MLRNGIPSFEELQEPLPWYRPRKYYYKLISLFLRTVGQLSDGLRIGYRHGFDSGIVMNYIYENRPHGKFRIGKALDAAFLDQTTCKAFRAVKQIQKDMITNYLGKRNGKETFIVDLASGKADYIYDALQEKNSNVKVLLRDINERTLKESEAIAERSEMKQNVSYEIGDALDRESLSRIPPRPDLIIEAGLYGIIHDDELIKKHLFELKDILNPGALLFNVQTYNRQIELIARTLVNQEGESCVWHLRPKELVIGWAREAGFKDPEIRMDPYGIYAVVLMRN
ncbi:MAG: class I SAM-dependent methyltransferase family protein [Deltaproteobacteria bacterium]